MLDRLRYEWQAKSRMNASSEIYKVGRDHAGMPHPLSKEDLYDPTFLNLFPVLK